MENFNIPRHIRDAIRQAKKDGHKGVIGFVGGFEEYQKYTKLRNDGKLEVFTQRYKCCNHICECLLMRKPKNK